MLPAGNPGNVPRTADPPLSGAPTHGRGFDVSNMLEGGRQDSAGPNVAMLKLAGKLSSLEAQVKALQTERTELAQQLQAKEEEHQAREQEVLKLKGQLRTAAVQAEDQLGVLRTQVHAAEVSQAEAARQLDARKAELQALTTAREESNANLRRQVATLQTSLSAANAQLESHSRAQSQQTALTAALEAELQTLRQQVEATKASLAAAQQAMNSHAEQVRRSLGDQQVLADLLQTRDAALATARQALLDQEQAWSQQQLVVQQLHTDLDLARKAAAAAEARASVAETALTDTIKEKQELCNLLAASEKTLSLLRATLQQNSTALTELTQQVAASQQERAAAVNKAHAMAVELQHARDGISAEAAGAQQAVQAAEKRLMELEQQLVAAGAAKKRVVELEQQLQVRAQPAEAAKQRLMEVEQQLAASTQVAAAAKQRAVELEEQLSASTQAAGAAKQRAVELEQQLLASTKATEAAKQQLTRMESRLQQEQAAVQHLQQQVGVQHEQLAAHNASGFTTCTDHQQSVAPPPVLTGAIMERQSLASGAGTAAAATLQTGAGLVIQQQPCDTELPQGAEQTAPSTTTSAAVHAVPSHLNLQARQEVDATAFAFAFGEADQYAAKVDVPAAAALRLPSAPCPVQQDVCSAAQDASWVTAAANMVTGYAPEASATITHAMDSTTTMLPYSASVGGMQQLATATAIALASTTAADVGVAAQPADMAMPAVAISACRTPAASAVVPGDTPDVTAVAAGTPAVTRTAGGTPTASSPALATPYAVATPENITTLIESPNTTAASATHPTVGATPAVAAGFMTPILATPNAITPTATTPALARPHAVATPASSRAASGLPGTMAPPVNGTLSTAAAGFITPTLATPDGVTPLQAMRSVGTTFANEGAPDLPATALSSVGTPLAYNSLPDLPATAKAESRYRGSTAGSDTAQYKAGSELVQQQVTLNQQGGTTAAPCDTASPAAKRQKLLHTSDGGMRHCAVMPAVPCDALEPSASKAAKVVGTRGRVGGDQGSGVQQQGGEHAVVAEPQPEMDTDSSYAYGGQQQQLQAEMPPCVPPSAIDLAPDIGQGNTTLVNSPPRFPVTAAATMPATVPSTACSTEPSTRTSHVLAGLFAALADDNSDDE